MRASNNLIDAVAWLTAKIVLVFKGLRWRALGLPGQPVGSACSAGAVTEVVTANQLAREAKHGLSTLTRAQPKRSLLG